jgi:glycosyltransferase involved in cell wall biosynthesis
MKILVAAASWASNISGLQRHALNLTRCLLLRPEITELHLVIAPWQQDFVQAAGIPFHPRLSIHVAEMVPGVLSRNSWYYGKLPKFARWLDVNLVHLTYPVPVNRTAFHCPTVVTLHDLYPYEIPGNFGFPRFIFNRAILKHCLRNVDSIACVSETTRLRLRQYAPEAVWGKAVRIYNCVEGKLACASRSPIPYWRDEPFLLCVAQHRRNKNLPLLIRTFSSLARSGQIGPDLKLVVVGITASQTATIHRLVASYRLSQRVHFLEGLSEPELQWCYRNCAALAAPSITEGFGLPVAEGLLAGCRVLCSDIPAHREIAEGQCTFVKIGSNAESALAKAILFTILKEPKRSPVLLPQFSASAIAEQHTELYRRLITAREVAEDSIDSVSTSLPASERQSV